MIIDLIIFSLAQSFLRAQGLGSDESGIVLLYAGLGLSRIRRNRDKESPRINLPAEVRTVNPFYVSVLILPT